MRHVIGDSYSGQTATEKQTNNKKQQQESNDKKQLRSCGHKGGKLEHWPHEGPG